MEEIFRFLDIVNNNVYKVNEVENVKLKMRERVGGSQSEALNFSTEYNHTSGVAYKVSVSIGECTAPTCALDW